MQLMFGIYTKSENLYEEVGLKLSLSLTWDSSVTVQHKNEL